MTEPRRIDFDTVTQLTACAIGFFVSLYFVLALPTTDYLYLPFAALVVLSVVGLVIATRSFVSRGRRTP